jgi:tetratricopeptide (TPR) repeat protein/tRNA A-37 threonylcarbamoyl transferase component Bud32
MPEHPETVAPDDPIERLLAECLTAADPIGAIAAACEAHPAHGEALRRRFESLARMGLLPDGDAAGAPRRVGRFVLGERLGGGGMGVVHRAREEPLGREVALKLVRADQLGVEGARRRFLREIEAVAALSHPGIVPILSFGEADGAPWYSMPIVEGRSLADVIARLCELGRSPVADDVHQQQPGWTLACCAIAAQVADALAHAHARGVVHRDVKPSNVMLTRDGRALLLDFGLAQVAGQDSMTRTGAQPGSLPYMSPEQVRGEPVDDRTDVWSLGVVLYELLALRQPFAADTEARTRSNILAAAPPSPLGSSGQRLPWDVRVVLAKALAPEPGRRYAGAAAFASDLQALLAHRPIAARRPSALLRLRRLAQRRPTLATGAGLGLLLATALPTALFLQERSARAAIERQMQTSHRVTALLADLFREVDPERARGATMPARAVLDRGVRQIRGELQDEPEVKAALLEAMGTVYLNLGLLADAEPLLREMEALRRPANDGDAALRARTLDPLARLAAARGDAAEAERLWRTVVDALRAVDRDSTPALLASLHVAHALWRQDRLGEAEDLLATTVAALRQRLPADDLDLADALLAQAIFLQQRLDPVRARPLFAEANGILRARLPADHPRTIAAATAAAGNLHQLGEYSAAEAQLRAALAAAAQVFDAQHPQLAFVREQLATLLLSMSRAPEARAQIDLALAACREVHRPPHTVLARLLDLDGAIAFEQGDLHAAEAALTASLGMYEQLAPHGSLEQAAALSNACRLWWALGRRGDAAAAGTRSLELAQRLGQRDASARALAHAHLAYLQSLEGATADARTNVDAALRLIADRPETQARAFVHAYAAEVHCAAGDGATAERFAREALADWARIGADAGRGWSLTTLGWALELQRRLPEAERELRAALEIRRRCHGAEHPYVALTLGELGVALALQKDLAGAEAMLREAVAIRRRTRTEGDVNLARPLLNLATVVMRRDRADEAAAMAAELLDLLRGQAVRGNPEAVGAVLLCQALLRGPAADAIRARADGVCDLAQAVLADDDPRLSALREALARR